MSEHPPQDCPDYGIYHTSYTAQKELQSHPKAEFAHSVNFKMSFGCNVLPEDINKKREWLGKDQDDSLFDMRIDKDSTDEEIANFLAVENYRDTFLSEVVEMEMDDTHHIYSKEDTEGIVTEYHERVKEFKRMNKIEC